MPRLLICGRCGDRMTVRYTVRQGHPAPLYACQRRGIASAQRACQIMSGTTLDEAVAEVVLEALTPAALEACHLLENAQMVLGGQGRLPICSSQAGLDMGPIMLV